MLACSYPLSRFVARQLPTGNMDLSTPALFASPVDTVPTDEARGTSVRTSSPLSPLGLFGIPPATPESSILPSTAFLRTVDRQTDAQDPLRRRASDSPSSRSRRLPPVPEDPRNLGIPAEPLSAPLQPPMAYGERKQTRPSTAPGVTASPSPMSDSRRQLSIDSVSSQSTSSSSGSINKRRLFSFGFKRSQPASDTSPSVHSDTLPPGLPSSGSPSISHGAPANPISPNRSRTTPTKKAPKTPARQPSRSATLSVSLPQSRKWEPVNYVVLELLERAATGSEGLLRSAIDGSVSAGNLEGLVSRVISDSDIADSARDDHFRATFVTIYHLFSTSERLFNILKRRFETTEIKPVTVRSRYS